jgi:hypothetical protein
MLKQKQPEEFYWNCRQRRQNISNEGTERQNGKARKNDAPSHKATYQRLVRTMGIPKIGCNPDNGHEGNRRCYRQEPGFAFYLGCHGTGTGVGEARGVTQDGSRSYSADCTSVSVKSLPLKSSAAFMDVASA